jgi:hypothetical protein
VILEEEAHGREGGRSRTARVLAVVLGFKACLFLTISLSLHLLPPIFDAASYQKRFHWPENEPATSEWIFKTWDTAHYLYLSEEGYSHAAGSAAFHPLWPALIGLAAPIFGSSLWAAMVLANLLSAIGLVVLHRLTARLTDEGIADTTLLLALAYPGALFYCLPYTESLFLLITVSVFSLLVSGRVGAAAWLSALAAPTRAVGVFLVIPLMWRLVSDWRRGRRPWWHCAAGLAPLVGMALTLGIMWAQTGNWLAGMEAQARYASQGSIAKIFAPVEFYRSFVDVWGVHGVLHSGIDRVFFVVMIVGVAAVVRWEGRVGPWSLYSAAMILVPAMTMSFMSFTRYPTVVFPIFMGFGVALSRHRRRELRWIVLVVFLVIQFFFLIRHINASWAA